MTPFLKALLLGANGIAANAAGIDPTATASPAALGMALAGKGQAPSGLGEMPYGNDSPAPAPQNTANSTAAEAPITIEGDGWKPRHPNFWTFLGDVVGSHYGKGLIGTNAQDSLNVHDAVGEFAQDPLKAIKRLQRLHGHEGEAIKLYNQYEDDQRADKQAEALAGMRKAAIQDRGRGILASMMGGVTDAATYQYALPTMQKYAEQYELDPPPEEYDPQKIKFWQQTGIKPDQQVDNSRADMNTGSQIDYRNQRLQQYRERLGQQARDTDSRISHRSATESEALRHHQVTEGQGQARVGMAQAKQPKIIQTERGPGELSSLGYLRLGDGSIWKKSPDGKKWNRVK